jgi:hypothetical protein
MTEPYTVFPRPPHRLICSSAQIQGAPHGVQRLYAAQVAVVAAQSPATQPKTIGK